MNFNFHLAAEAEHLEHIGRYKIIQASLGARYLSDFEFTMQRICESPTRFRVEPETNVRFVSMMNFPYFVVYREVDGLVQVLAVPHFRQRPGYWIARF